MINTLNSKENLAVEDFRAKLTSLLGPRVKNLLLFGSKARGDFNPDSDIDIFILVDRSDREARKIIASLTTEILLKHSILLSPKIIEESHFKFLKHLDTAFARNIEREGIKL